MKVVDLRNSKHVKLPGGSVEAYKSEMIESFLESVHTMHGYSSIIIKAFREILSNADEVPETSQSLKRRRENDEPTPMEYKYSLFHQLSALDNDAQLNYDTLPIEKKRKIILPQAVMGSSPSSPSSAVRSPDDSYLTNWNGENSSQQSVQPEPLYPLERSPAGLFSKISDSSLSLPNELVVFVPRSSTFEKVKPIEFSFSLGEDPLVPSPSTSIAGNVDGDFSMMSLRMNSLTMEDGLASNASGNSAPKRGLSARPNLKTPLKGILKKRLGVVVKPKTKAKKSVSFSIGAKLCATK